MSEHVSSRRLRWAAVALSFLAIGVGHVYCGRIAKGLVLYFAWFAVPVLGLVAALLPRSSLVLVALLLLPAISMFAIYVYAAADAFSSAAKAPPDYKLQDYNRGGLYALLVLVQLACPVAFMAGMRELAFEAYYLPAASMSPSLLRGDRVLVNKLKARDHYPERGDVVVFNNPDPSRGGAVFIKRVIALAGDKIAIEGGKVEVNGRELERERIPAEALSGYGKRLAGQPYYEFNIGRRYKVEYGDSAQQPDTERVEWTVPQRSVFVLGDNRDRSRDSRHFGAVHVGDVLGYAQYIYFPAGSWSRFGAL